MTTCLRRRLILLSLALWSTSSLHAENGKLGSFSLGNRAPLVDTDADALPDD